MNQPVRVLHVLGRLRRGGVETWLMHVLRNIDRHRFRFDFLVHSVTPGDYDDEVRSLGSRIFPCPDPRYLRRYARRFRAILSEHGPYDVVHSHVHHYSGFVLRLAHQAGVPRRIAHSHTAPRQAGRSLARRLYLGLAKSAIRRHATAGLACSSEAACSLFGDAWQADGRWSTLPYGIDLSPFDAACSRPAVREELGLPPDALVVGHVGTFSDVKNHKFFVQVAAEIRRRREDAWFLLVGDGPLRAKIETDIARAGLADRFVLAGSRADVPRLMRGGMDAFLFPSRYEGLGLVLVEAQAAGLPSVFSNRVPREAVVVEHLLRSLPLSEPASAWAESLLALYEANLGNPSSDALECVKQSDFTIEKSVRRLEKTYTE